MSELEVLLCEIRNCVACEKSLPQGPRPILAASEQSRILIIGQAPGIRVHESGIPWDDPSGNRLREWMNVSTEQFYDSSKVAIVPMGFCYPGTGTAGDLPPRPECAELWHGRLIPQLESIELTLLVGRYAQQFQLGGENKPTLTETVRAWKNYHPNVIPLPHPSPRNNRWLKKNPWFEEEVLPYLKRRVSRLIKP